MVDKSNLPKKHKLEVMKMNIEAFERSMPAIKNRIEVESLLLKHGAACLDKPASECMLLAAMHGLVNVIKYFESMNYPLTSVNAFGEGLLHFAAKGN